MNLVNPEQNLTPNSAFAQEKVPKDPAAANPINFEDLRQALAMHGLLLGHDFEFAPEPYRAELRGMAKAGIIFEPKAGHWKYVSSEPSGECEF